MKAQAIALCRVSTPEQRLNNSLNRQEVSVRKAAEVLGVEIVKWWSGDVSSKVGKNVKRKDLIQAHEFCKAKRSVKYLIVDEPDRFMRSVRELFYWCVEFEKIGVSVHFAQNPELNGQDAMSTLLTALSAFRGEGSNEERMNKSINGHVHALQEGRYTFPPKPGYMKGSHPGIHIPHPSEFKPFQQALLEVESRLYTPSEALKRLNVSEFVKTHSKLKIDKFTRFITDPYYAGIVEINRQVKARNENGLHQPMITKEQHLTICEIVNGRPLRTYSRKSHNPEFPLKKMLLCGDCANGSKYTGSMQGNGKGGKYPKYRCRGCGAQYRREDVNLGMDRLLASIRLNVEHKEKLLKGLVATWEKRRAGAINQIKSLMAAKASQETTKSKLVVSLASADLELQEDIKAEIRRVKGEINDTEQQIDALSNSTADLEGFVRFSIETLLNLKQKWWELEPEDRSLCQQLLFPDGIYFDADKKVSTPRIPSLFAIARETENKKEPVFDTDSLLVELRGIAPRSARSQA